ncbi:hypothetical protein AMTRI_Chr09g40750 [Amborella trichopoda]
MQERRDKGLCFNCNEKFVLGHCCKKLFLIEGCYEEEDDYDKLGLEEDVLDEFHELPEISLHAIYGLRVPETMRVKGSLGHIAVMVLIDSGGTHNFMSEMLAKKVGMQPTNGSRFEVMVASGEKLPTPGYEVVLGAKWLRTLGPIMWDLAKLLMTFKVAGKEVTLKGVTSFNDKVIGDHEFYHDAKRNKKGMLLHLYSIGTPLPLTNGENQLTRLQRILEEFQDVFDEPNGLPPLRSHDHRIPLKAGSKPVCTKAYCHPHY